jgi:hypothetical protein
MVNVPGNEVVVESSQVMYQAVWLLVNWSAVSIKIVLTLAIVPLLYAIIPLPGSTSIVEPVKL